MMHVTRHRDAARSFLASAAAALAPPPPPLVCPQSDPPRLTWHVLLQVDRKQVPADFNRKLQAIQVRRPAGRSLLPQLLLLSKAALQRSLAAARSPRPAASSRSDLTPPHRPPLTSFTTQAKVGEAVQQLPSGFLGRFEGGDEAPLDYFLARQVLGQLAEGAEKGFLGGLKGAAGEWEKLVKAYEYNRKCAAVHCCPCLGCFVACWLGG